MYVSTHVHEPCMGRLIRDIGTLGIRPQLLGRSQAARTRYFSQPGRKASHLGRRLEQQLGCVYGQLRVREETDGISAEPPPCPSAHWTRHMPAHPNGCPCTYAGVPGSGREIHLLGQQSIGFRPARPASQQHHSRGPLDKAFELRFRDMFVGLLFAAPNPRSHVAWAQSFIDTCNGRSMDSA